MRPPAPPPTPPRLTPAAPPPPRRFPAWHAHLRAGASLLLYGVGAKDDVALAFVAQSCPEARLVVADGASPACTVRRILATLGHGRGPAAGGRAGGRKSGGQAAAAAAAAGPRKSVGGRDGRDDDESSGGSSDSAGSDDDDGGSVAEAFPDDHRRGPGGGAPAVADAWALDDVGEGGGLWPAAAPASESLSAAIARVSAGFFHRPVSTVLVVRALDQLVQRSELRRRAGGGAAMPLLLAALAAQPSLRLVATVDHVNTPLLIDEEATLRGRLVRV